MTRENRTQCDLVVFSAHPDDAELCCGGLLLVSAAKGWKTAIVDLTRGELGSLGTAEIRAKEAAEAADVLGLTERLNLGLPDGHLRDCDEYRQEIVRVVRKLKPRVVVAPPRDDHHPDHMAAGELLRQSFYLCGVRNYLPELDRWLPRALLHYVGTRAAEPQIVVDVSEVMDRRNQAVRCYKSQFERTERGAKLRINTSYFLDAIVGRLRYFGSLIGVPFGEAYTSESPLPVSDLVSLFDSDPWKDR